ncbi:hypothetical protein ADK60_09880 [Streptomyces sp. XY431]|nr:hypothetical protein ADK60_09880 [Streptomyces sp. XY431]
MRRRTSAASVSRSVVVRSDLIDRIALPRQQQPRRLPGAGPAGRAAPTRGQPRVGLSAGRWVGRWVAPAAAMRSMSSWSARPVRGRA